MTKPFIKQRAFLRPSSVKKKPALSSASGTLPVETLDQVSCFETLRAYRGKLFCLASHLERLEDSCEGVGKTLPLEKSELERWITQALRESALHDAMARFSIHWNKDSEGFFLIMIREFLGYPASWYEKGVCLSTAVAKRWTLRAQDSQIKSSNYISGVLTALDQPRTNAHEFIFLNESGYVAEGAISNLFLVKAKRLLTPSVSSGILRGVTRGTVMDLAKKRGLGVSETILTRHDIYIADECFMANTSSEVLPVTSVDGRAIADGRPGVITKQLGRDFKKYIQFTLGKNKK